MSIILIYATFSSAAEARTICSALLDARLIACANIMPPHTALYDWQDKREEASEVSVIMKTQDTLFGGVKAEILKLHSYENPCIVALPLTDGHAPFIDWVQSQTGPFRE